MDYLKAAENRKSIRDFKETPVADRQVKEIEDYFAVCRRLEPETDVEMVTVHCDFGGCMEGNAGYQGMMFNAPCYLVFLSEVKGMYVKNAGYITEDMILKLTDMGLDSCWLTVLDGEGLKKSLELRTDKQVVSVVAFGHGKQEKGLLRLDIKSPSDVKVTTREGHVAPKIKLEEMVYGETWGKGISLDDDQADESLHNAFYAASLAPTFLNRQPYRFIRDSGVVVLVKLLDTMTGEVDARLNCGAVMLNFAAVLSERRPVEPKWILEKPEKEYVLPANCEIAGYCLI